MSGKWSIPKYLALAATAVLVFNACGSNAASPTTASPTTAGTVSGGPVSSSAPGGPECNNNKIVVTYYSEPSVQDFQQFGTDGDNDVRANLVETLLDRQTQPGQYADSTEATTGQYTGRLATDWKYDATSSTITFHLHPDAKFSNGDPVTSEDVKWSFQRGLEDPQSYLKGVMAMLTVSSADQIDTPDPQTVVFHIQKLNPFTYDLMAIWATAITDKKTVLGHATSDDPWANDWMKNNLVGSGPYVLTNAQPGVEYDFSPNPNYWQKDKWPCNGGIVVKVIPDASSRLLLLKQGAVDVARGLNYKDIKALETTPGVSVLRYPTPDMRELGLNVNVKPFDNVMVRQAIAYAIPYQDILNTVWYGYAGPLNSIVPKGMPTSDFATWPYTTDLAKAKSLLTQAGYPDGFETTLLTRSEDEEDQAAAVLIQSSLAKIGVNVKIEKLLTAAYASREFGQRDMPMFFWNWISFTNDPYYDFNFLVQSGQGTNFANYKNPQVDALIQQGMYEQDPTKRAQISSQIQQIVANDAFAIGIGQPDSIVATRSNVHGWMQYPDLNARYYTLWKSGN